MNAHNEQHDPASAVVKQNLTTQPAAAQEAVAWVPPSFFDKGVVAATARRKPPSETAVAMRGEYVPLYAAPVTAAPVVAHMIDGRTEQGLTFDKAAAETMAFSNGGTARALGFVKGTTEAPHIMYTNFVNLMDILLDDYAEVNWSVDPPLSSVRESLISAINAYADVRQYLSSMPSPKAAPGIDLREFGVALIYAADVLRSVGGANTIVANKIDLLIELIDASPKGAMQAGDAEVQP